MGIKGIALHRDWLNKHSSALFLLVSLLGNVVFCIFRSSIGIVLLDITTEFHLTEIQGGIILSATSSVMLVLLGFGALLSYRIGRKRTLTGGMILLSLGFFLIGSTTNYLFTLIYLGIVGIGGSLFLPTLFSMLGEVKPGSRGLLVGIAASACGLGSFIGPLMTGSSIGSYGWRFPFFLFALMCLCLVLTQCVLSIVMSNQGVKKRSTYTGSRWRNILCSQNVLILCFAMGFSNTGFWALIGWTPTFLRTFMGFDASQSGSILGLLSLLGTIGSILLGGISDRLSRRTVCAVAGIVTATAAYLFYTSLPHLLLLAALSSIIGFFALPIYSLTISLAQDSVDSNDVNAVTGLIQTIGLLGSLLGPLVVGTTIVALGIRETLVCSICLPYLVGSFCVLTYRKEK